ncbi:hypothetical protein niasHS_004512 [Heterodera schachtii]|uniref:WXG100 family type VII secretion target n=1 Tax=Heterodera schachtii TaxID=97005 RepID=A0ABD2JMF6_HETSC
MAQNRAVEKTKEVVTLLERSRSVIQDCIYSHDANLDDLENTWHGSSFGKQLHFSWLQNWILNGLATHDIASQWINITVMKYACVEILKEIRSAMKTMECAPRRN